MRLFLFFFVLVLCSCAGPKKVGANYSDTVSPLKITHESVVAGVYIDNEFAGHTPLLVSVSLGEHRVVMNYSGQIIYDSTITVTDGYNRNSKSLLAGGGVAGFASALLISGPTGVLLAPIPFLISGYGAKFLAQHIHVTNVFGYNAEECSFASLSEAKMQMYSMKNMFFY